MEAKSRIGSRIAFACLTALMLLSGVAAPVSAAQVRAKAKAVRVIRPILPSPEKDAAIVVDANSGRTITTGLPLVAMLLLLDRRSRWDVRSKG